MVEINKEFIKEEIKKDASNIEKILVAFVTWSGVSSDSPQDTEIISTGYEVITLDDLQEAFAALRRLEDLLLQK